MLAQADVSETKTVDAGPVNEIDFVEIYELPVQQAIDWSFNQASHKLAFIHNIYCYLGWSLKILFSEIFSATCLR